MRKGLTRGVRAAFTSENRPKVRFEPHDTLRAVPYRIPAPVMDAG